MEKSILLFGTMTFIADGVYLSYLSRENDKDIDEDDQSEFYSYGVFRALLQKACMFPSRLALSLDRRHLFRSEDDNDDDDSDEQWISDDNLNKALECIDLCSESLTEITIIGSSRSEMPADLLQLPTAEETLINRACSHHLNTVNSITLHMLCAMSFSEFVQVLSSKHCHLDHIYLDYQSGADNGTWTPQCFGNLDYSKLNMIGLGTNDVAVTRALLSSLRDSPPRQLTNFYCNHGICQDDFGLLAETIQRQTRLESLCFDIGTSNIGHLMELLERILSPLNPALKDLHIEALNRRGSVIGLRDYMPSQQWQKCLIPLLQKNTTLLDFCWDDALHTGNGECRLLNGILERNRILANLKETVGLQKEPPNVVLTPPVVSLGKRGKLHHTLAKTISKLASVPNVEPTALYYYLQQNSDRLMSLKRSGDNNSSNNKKVGSKRRKRKSAPSRGVMAARKKRSGRAKK